MPPCAQPQNLRSRWPLARTARCPLSKQSGLYRNLVNAIRATKMPRSDWRCVVRSAAGSVPSHVPSFSAVLMADADSMFVEFKQACGRTPLELPRTVLPRGIIRCMRRTRDRDSHVIVFVWNRIGRIGKIPVFLLRLLFGYVWWNGANTGTILSKRC